MNEQVPAMTETTLVRAHRRAAWLALLPYLPLAVAQVWYFHLGSSDQEMGALAMSWILYSGYAIVCAALVVSQLPQGGVWRRILLAGFVGFPIILGAIGVVVGAVIAVILGAGAAASDDNRQIVIVLLWAVVGAIFGAYLNRLIVGLTDWPADDPALRRIRPMNIAATALAVTAAVGTALLAIRNGQPTQSLAGALMFIALAGPLLYAALTLLIRCQPHHVRRPVRRLPMHAVVAGVLALAFVAAGHRVWTLRSTPADFLYVDLKTYLAAARSK